ncbi:MAG: hypothetical protein RLZZ210_472 [Pseudomonadota bacterium]|jgi:ankyrin repeat protein
MKRYLTNRNYDFFNQPEQEMINELNCSPYMVYTKTPDGDNLLHWACKKNSLGLVKFVIESGKLLKAKDTKGNNALHLACMNNHDTEVIKYLIESGKFDLNATNLYGHNALHLACMNNHDTEVIKYLIESGKFDLNATNTYGNDALHLACMHNHDTEVIKYLIESGKFVLNATDTNGNNALHLACMHNHNTEVIKYLIEKGISCSDINNINQTALEVLKSRVETEIYNKFVEYIDQAEFANQLISTKISNFDSPYLNPELCNETKQFIINCVNNKLSNIIRVEKGSLYNNHTKAIDNLHQNLSIFMQSEVYHFQDLFSNSHIPVLQLLCVKQIAKNQTPITNTIFDMCVENFSDSPLYKQIFEQINFARETEGANLIGNDVESI